MQQRADVFIVNWHAECFGRHRFCTGGSQQRREITPGIRCVWSGHVRRSHDAQARILSGDRERGPIRVDQHQMASRTQDPVHFATALEASAPVRCCNIRSQKQASGRRSYSMLNAVRIADGMPCYRGDTLFQRLGIGELHHLRVAIDPEDSPGGGHDGARAARCRWPGHSQRPPTTLPGPISSWAIGSLLDAADGRRLRDGAEIDLVAGRSPLAGHQAAFC